MAEMQIDQQALADYLAQLHSSEVENLTLTLLGQSQGEGSGAHKGYGYGKPVRLSYRVGKDTLCRVLHTTKPGPFGHEHMSDRAAEWLWAHQAFNTLPGHVHSHDVGAFVADGMRTLGDAREFFLLTGYARGSPYGQDLQRLGPLDDPEQRDISRCDSIGDYLLSIHGENKPDPGLYKRSIRQLVGHHECIFGLIDSYPDDDPVATPKRLQAIEQAVGRWRWRLKPMSHRLRRVHGDFHPWNLIFDDQDRLTTLDRSRGEYGDPADDVVAVSINYVFQALVDRGAFTGACRILFDRLWQRYLASNNDDEILSVAPPFFAFRGLVLASTIWYPDTQNTIRDQMLRLIERLLDQDRFEPDHIDELLAPEQ